MNIFLLGYYGFGNWGDELSLFALGRELSTLTQWKKCSLIPHVLVPGDTIPVPVENARTVSRRSLRDVASSIRLCDVVMVGGGSLLQDKTSLRSLMYYTSLLGWALLWRKPVVFYRCGLGPFRTVTGLALARYIVSRCKLFVARDPATARVAERLGCLPDRIREGADPLFLPGLWKQPMEKEDKRVAVCVRNASAKQEDALTRAVVHLSQEVGDTVDIVAFHKEHDFTTASRIADRSKGRVIAFRSWEEIPSYFSSLQALFTMRLHPAVLATLFNVPWAAFDLDPKIAALTGCFTRPPLISWPQFDSHELAQLYAAGMSRAEERQHVREGFSRLALENTRDLAVVLASARGEA